MASEIVAAVYKRTFGAFGHCHANTACKLSSMYSVVEEELTIVNRHFWSPVTSICLTEGGQRFPNLIPMYQISARQNREHPGASGWIGLMFGSVSIVVPTYFEDERIGKTSGPERVRVHAWLLCCHMCLLLVHVTS